MDKKKIIAWSVAIGFLALLVFWFAHSRYGSNNDSKSSEPESQEQPSSFPRASSSAGSSLPSASGLNGAVSIIIDSDDSPAAVRVKLSEFSQGSDQLRWGEFKGSDGSRLSLDSFSSYAGMKIDSGLASLLDESAYAVFSCGTDDKKETNGIYFSLKILPNYKGNLFADETAHMRSWEETMPYDLKGILFPDKEFSSVEVSNGSLAFKDGEYRYASIDLPGNEKSSINYELVDDYIVIANSKKCLERAITSLYGPDPKPE